jgi:hypothetical protein
MPDAREHELGLAAFVSDAKRERVLGFLERARTRHKVVERLWHFSDWDPECTVRVPPPFQTPAGVLQELARRGARGAVHVVSATRQLDGLHVDVAEAVQAVVGTSSGTVVSCIPGKLAYFEGEADGDRVILWRPG